MVKGNRGHNFSTSLRTTSNKLEPLERRRLLSAAVQDVSVIIDAGICTITGTDQREDIRISSVSDDSTFGSHLQVVVNGHATDLKDKIIHGFNISAGAGDDIITFA